jgi:hypothetical protein
MIKIQFRYWGINVEAGPVLRQTGWYGGQIVRFVGNMIVEKALPNEIAGVLIHGYKLEDYDGKPYSFEDGFSGSRSTPYRYENNPIDSSSHKTSMISDDGMFDINKNAYDISQVYTYNQKLYSNIDGILTNVNAGGDCIGIVASLPSDLNGWMRVKLKW